MQRDGTASRRSARPYPARRSCLPSRPTRPGPPPTAAQARSSTRSSRWTTSRSYPGPARRASSAVERPSSAGQLLASIVDQPAGRRRARLRQTGRPGRPPRTCPRRPSRRPAAATCRARRRPRTAPASSTSRPRGLGGVREPEQPASRCAGRSAANQVPTSSPASAGAACVGGREQRGDAGRRRDRRRLHLGHHAAGADAALRRPSPTSTPSRSCGPRDHADPPGAGAARRPVVERVDVGQQHERVGVHQVRDQGGQAVVVAEPDLVGGHGVVLVDDRARRRARAAGPGCAGRCGSACAGRCRRRSAAPARPAARAGRTPRCSAPPAAPGRRWPRPAGWPGRAGGAASPSGARPAAIAPEETSTTSPPAAGAPASTSTSASSRSASSPPSARGQRATSRP